MTEEEGRACEDQVEFCNLRLQTILDAISEIRKQMEAHNLVADAREKEHYKRMESMTDLITGGGKAGTGLAPRINALEIMSGTNQRNISKLEDRLEKYIEAKADDERKLYRGILAALGTAVLSLLGQLAMFLVQHLAEGGTP